jgi:hypothetical protein
MVEKRNFAKLAGEFACDNFRKRHEAGLRVGRHGEAALEGSRAVSSADPSTENEGVAAVEGDGWFVSVRNMVPTLTSSKRRGLSLNGRC